MTDATIRPRRPAAPPRTPVRADRAGHSPAPGRNLGPRSLAMLAAAGITTPVQLRRLGAVAAYRRVQRTVSGTSLNLLYALAGAIDHQDWRVVRRTRRLELLLALEDAERRTAGRPESASLLHLRNIGPAMRRDLERLGIRSPTQLARQHADRLYLRLQQLTGKRHDPCVWDTFAAAIHQARTGQALPWWHFTAERKRRQAEGTFVPAAKTARRARRSVG